MEILVGNLGSPTTPPFEGAGGGSGRGGREGGEFRNFFLDREKGERRR